LYRDSFFLVPDLDPEALGDEASSGTCFASSCPDWKSMIISDRRCVGMRRAWADRSTEEAISQDCGGNDTTRRGFINVAVSIKRTASDWELTSP